jgi:hypothetical protein
MNFEFQAEQERFSARHVELERQRGELLDKEYFMTHVSDIGKESQRHTYNATNLKAPKPTRTRTY